MGRRKEKAEPGRKQKAKMRKDSPSHVPNKVTSVALKPANKGIVHWTTINGRMQGAAVSPMRHHIKGRGEAFICDCQAVERDNAKQSRRAMLGSAVDIQKEVAPEKKKVACQAFSLSSNLFTSIVCYQS